MNLLNEVAHQFPDALSFAAGRPFEGFFELGTVHRYLDTFHRHLLTTVGGDEAKANQLLFQYGRTKGIIHRLIAEHLRVDEGIAAEPESVVVTVGCQEALYLTMRALRREPEDALMVVVPAYIGVHGAAQLTETRVLPVRDGGGQGVDFDDLLATLTAARARGIRPRALYLTPDFGNPSGVSLSVDTRRRLLDTAAEHDFLILEDNPYGLFAPDDGLPTMRALDHDGRVVYLGTFAKTGIPGARVGYVVADQPVTGPDGRSGILADELAKIKSMLTVNTSPIAQAVIGGKLLENGYSLRAANERERGIYQRNLAHLLDGLAARFPPRTSPGISWNVPRGGFFLLLTLPFTADDELLQYSANKHQVLWTPVHHFYADGRPRNQIRLSFSHLSPEEIDTGLDRLAGLIHEQAGG
jgi:(S)-3,5-dihydroxyphenylglycine transaminase